MDVPGPGWAPAWAHPSGCTMSLGERFVSFGVTPSSSEEQLKVCPLWNAVSLRASAEPGTEEEKGIHLETKSIHSLLLRSPVQVPIFLERPLAMAYRGGGWEPCGHLTPPDLCSLLDSVFLAWVPGLHQVGLLRWRQGRGVACTAVFFPLPFPLYSAPLAYPPKDYKWRMASE